jgi:Xaa-Pro aminopeptidase
MLTEKLAKIYRATGADVVFVKPDYLRRYVTGFYSTDGFVLIDSTGCTFVTDLRYAEAAQKSLEGSGIAVVVGSYDKTQELLAPYHTVAVPFSLTTYPEYFKLTEWGHTLLDADKAFGDAMIVKSDDELSHIAKACDIAEEGFNALLPQIKEGMTETEVAALLEYQMRKRGAEGTSFDTICAFGANASVPHHATGEKKLAFGDEILLDFGCKVNGYCSDITRTVLFGDDHKHEAFKKSYNTVLAAHLRVQEQLKAGMTGREGDEIARAVLRKEGLAEYFTHSLGHGVGLNIHEAPYLSPKGMTVLRDGMVFSDEPGVYVAGEYGIRIEDTVHLKDGHVQSFMHKTEKQLVIL